MGLASVGLYPNDRVAKVERLQTVVLECSAGLEGSASPQAAVAAVQVALLTVKSYSQP